MKYADITQNIHNIEDNLVVHHNKEEIEQSKNFDLFTFCAPMLKNVAKCRNNVRQKSITTIISVQTFIITFPFCDDERDNITFIFIADNLSMGRPT
jgi:hypothetical protein